jgi:hypothetical protein
MDCEIFYLFIYMEAGTRHREHLLLHEAVLSSFVLFL